MTLATYPKKRLDIFVEEPALHLVLDCLREKGVQGYTVLQAQAGHGHTGDWTLDDSITNVGNMLCVVCIMDAKQADHVAEAVFAIVKRRVGVLTISDVMVMRPEHF